MLKYPLSSVTVVQVVDLSAITTSAPAAGSLLLEQWPRLSTWPSTVPHVSGTSTVTFTGTLMYCAFDSSVMMHTSAWYSPGCMPAVSTSTVMVELPPAEATPEAGLTLSQLTSCGLSHPREIICGRANSAL